MIYQFEIRSPQSSRIYKGGTPEVALKKFLNYLRKFQHERPVVVRLSNYSTHKFYNATVEWYTGELTTSLGTTEGEWWKIIRVDRE